MGQKLILGQAQDPNSLVSCMIKMAQEGRQDFVLSSKEPQLLYGT